MPGEIWIAARTASEQPPVTKVSSAYLSDYNSVKKRLKAG